MAKPVKALIRRARANASTIVPEDAEQVGAAPTKPGFMGRYMGKQLTHEVLPSRTAKAQLGSGDNFQRSMGNYAKQGGADVSGAKAPLQNLLAMAAMNRSPTNR